MQTLIILSEKMNFYKKYDYFQKIIFNQAGLNQAVKKTAQVFFVPTLAKK